MAAHSPASLDAPASESEDAASLGELLGADDSALERAEDAIVLERHLACLPERNREILRLRFQEDLKQREIGARLGLSQMHVSRLIRHSLEQLRSLTSSAADDSG